MFAKSVLMVVGMLALVAPAWAEDGVDSRGHQWERIGDRTCVADSPADSPLQATCGRSLPLRPGKVWAMQPDVTCRRATESAPWTCQQIRRGLSDADLAVLMGLYNLTRPPLPNPFLEGARGALDYAPGGLKAPRPPMPYLPPPVPYNPAPPITPIPPTYECQPGRG
jgi:hypothetical protein